MKRLRLWLRGWLGILSLERAANARHAELMKELKIQFAQLAAMERGALGRHSELIGALDRIEKRLIAAHVEHPSNYTPPVLDWDTVQAIALHDLEKEPQ